MTTDLEADGLAEFLRQAASASCPSWCSLDHDAEGVSAEEHSAILAEYGDYCAVLQQRAGEASEVALWARGQDYPMTFSPAAVVDTWGVLGLTVLDAQERLATIDATRQQLAQDRSARQI